MDLGEALRDVFSNPGFMPHLHCYLGKPSLIWTMVTSDAMIGVSYTVISLTLYRMVRRIRLPFHMMFLAFGLFIGACGAGHFMKIYTLWTPNYWAEAGLNSVIAVASVATALWMLFLTPYVTEFAALARSQARSHVLLREEATKLEHINAEHEETRRALEAARAADTASLARTSVRLELALSAAHIGLWDWDLQSGVLEWSDTLKHMFGYDGEEFRDDYPHFAKCLHPDDLPEAERALQAAIQGKSKFDVEYRVVWPDGSVHWIAAQGRALCDANGTATRMVGTALNIDEQKRSQEEMERLVEKRTRELSEAQASLAHAAKLSALGEMAAGVAHEINTPLASISLQAEQVARLLGKPDLQAIKPRALDKITAIAKTTQRIASIIQGLRSFARDAEGDPYEVVPASHLVERALALCQARFKNHGINIGMEADPKSDTRVQCRAVQIEQIVLNLLSNAFDAVEPLDERWVRIGVQEAGRDEVEVSVTDSGKGIPPSVVEKMMQPFYTTKGIGRGTGLGLSISSGIAEAHGGSLRLDPGSERTRFVLRLPRHAAEHGNATHLGGYA